MDTIFALASGAGCAAIAVMRVSGPDAGPILAALCGGLPAPRRASLRRLRDADGTTLDRAATLWLPGPGSYTGEDGAELCLHGGPAVIEGVTEALTRAGARPAEPGEFTLRAFMSGRMDLIEAEGVADLVAAETEAQRGQALRQVEGELSARLAGWSARVRQALARQEALIDFSDEDLPPDVEAELLAGLRDLLAELRAGLSDARRGERLREGLVFAVAGAPNVGKSSLVNALAGREAAIVAASPGTTRDPIEVRVALGGVPVTLVDTAGLRETDDPVEAEGVRRARARARAADLVIAVRDADEDGSGLEGGVLVRSKIDLGAAVRDGVIGVSVVTGAGLDALHDRLAEAARALTQRAGPPMLTRARHRAALGEAAERIGGALDAALPELRAEELRLALLALGRITGAVDADAILGDIFAAFCIGK